MAIGATVHVFDVTLADIDRGVYEDLTVRLARHPSETGAFLLTRLLAYCLEYGEGIALSDGIAATDKPAVSITDATGRALAWIEVGAPDASRLHTGSKKADRVAVYTHRDPQKVRSAWTGKKIHRGEEIVLTSFDPGFVESAVEVLERRNTATLSITEGQAYLEINGRSLSSALHREPIV